MVRSLPVPLVVVFALALAPAVSAGTVTVGPTGSGAQFDDLAVAVAAAQPGDVVLVAAGQYLHTGTLDIGKPLTILGAGSASTSYTALPALPLDLPLPLWVHDLAPGEEVRIVGLALESGTFGGKVASTFVVTDCLGPVFLSDVASSASAMVLSTPGLAQVRDSAQVTLDGCVLDVVGGGANSAPTPALVVERSTVQVNDSWVRGGTPTMYLPGNYVFDGAPGVRATDSVVRLARTTVYAGWGQPSSPFAAPPTPSAGGAAVHATGSEVYVRGGPGALLEGGRGSAGISGSTVTAGPGGPALWTGPSSLVTSTPSVALSAGADSSGAVTTAAVSGAGAWIPLPAELALLAGTPELVAPGAALVFDLGGEAGSVYLTFFSAGQAPALAIPGVLGPVVLDLAAYQGLAPRVLDALGEATLAPSVPALPSLVGLAVVVQGLALAPGGGASASSPVLVAVR